LANGFLGYRKDGLTLRYRFDGLDEIITNPGNFPPFADPASGDTLAYDQEYLSQRLMQQLQASWFVTNDFQLDAQAAYTTYSREVFSTTLNKETGDTRLNIAEGAQSLVKFRGASFRATAFYRVSPVVSFQPGIDLNQESGQGERLKSGNNNVSDYAFFISSEITPNKNISIRPGLRFIHNSVYKAPPFIPSLNTKWVLSSSLDLRLSYARGFRAPSIRELYFNFFDVNHQVLGNPNLKAETSHSFTGSINWKGKADRKTQLSATLAGFYNDVNNMIDYLFVPGSDTAFLTNMLQSRSAGSTLSFTVRGQQWQLTAGAGATGFYNDFAESNATLPSMQWSAEANTNFNYRFTKAKLDLNLFYKFTGKRPYFSKDITGEVIPVNLKGFHMADLTLTKQLVSGLSLNAGIRNLFDVDRIRSTFARTGVHTGGGISNIGTGRSYFAGLQFNWTKK
jgi:outer membrane receptor for ferrienterochelin and colicins